MKTKLYKINIFIILSFTVLVAIIFPSCKKTSSSCATSGTVVNIGNPAGGGYSETVSTGYLIGFDNVTLDFIIIQPGSADGSITDVGGEGCLTFSDSVTTTAASAVYAPGHGYVGKYQDGHIVKFIAGAFNGGIVTINYIFQ